MADTAGGAFSSSTGVAEGTRHLESCQPPPSPLKRPPSHKGKNLFLRVRTQSTSAFNGPCHCIGQRPWAPGCHKPHCSLCSSGQAERLRAWLSSLGMAHLLPRDLRRGSASEPFSGPGTNPPPPPTQSGNAGLSKTTWKAISWHMSAAFPDLWETLIQEQKMLWLRAFKTKNTNFSLCWKLSFSFLETECLTMIIALEKKELTVRSKQ